MYLLEPTSAIIWDTISSSFNEIVAYIIIKLLLAWVAFNLWDYTIVFIRIKKSYPLLQMGHKFSSEHAINHFPIFLSSSTISPIQSSCAVFACGLISATRVLATLAQQVLETITILFYVVFSLKKEKSLYILSDASKVAVL